MVVDFENPKTETDAEKSESSPSEWEELAAWSAEHPLVDANNLGATKMQPESQPSQPSLEELRQKHLDALKGTYFPSDAEWDLILADEDFYDSKYCQEFLHYDANMFAKYHQDIYHPSDVEIQQATRPFIEAIHSDMPKLLALGTKIERRENLEEDLAAVMQHFCEKFKVERVPILSITTDDKTVGGYNESDNILRCQVLDTDPAAEIINTIAHEIWHARQHASGQQKYADNFEHYFTSSMDYVAYREQLVEKEAFAMGDAVEAAYRQADLAAHSEKNKPNFFNKIKNVFKKEAA